MDRKTCALRRSALLRQMRAFFDGKDYTEVDTPLLSPDLIPEATIQDFETTFTNEFLGSRNFYLVPSPEVFMKRLIAEGFGSIYQFCHCFRNSEQVGEVHNPEFTMLEYYTVGYDEQDSIPLTEELIASTAPKGTAKDLLPPFRKMTMQEALWEFAHVDLDACQRQADLQEACKRLDLMTSDKPEPWEDTFNRIFLTLVEPNLPQDKPLVLDRYPQQIECLAKREGNYRKRWEMYMRGVEIANCYDEERDVETVRDYYRREYAKLVSERTDSGLPIPDVDLSFADVFRHFPQTSGVAMGIDRLLMVQAGETELGALLLFPFSAMLANG
ncbi:MAG: amino acid--tRNA ligase-related protein [Sphaerochaetaceae bacterium]|nr:elongation factor P--(R)-beta-lysine ligase [Spirochaetaceae bacterium]MDY6342964.1 amino acid--tRNA ligase-related protein [Sphaerochaetaceae bacterium]